jgi:hypothetical protein
VYECSINPITNPNPEIAMLYHVTSGVRSAWIGDCSKKLYINTMEMEQMMACLLTEMKTNQAKTRHQSKGNEVRNDSQPQGVDDSNERRPQGVDGNNRNQPRKDDGQVR